MYNFWIVLTNLIHQYTIADTANVFAIIEGLATVVAAIGAIIAVIVTRKIAKRQIEIAEKQNEISDKQADIAEQQNKIALFENRSIAYDKLVNFFGLWNYFDRSNTENLKSILNVNILQAFISFREVGKLDIDYIASKDWFFFLSKQSEFFVKDMNSITQIMRLFAMTEEQKSILLGIVNNYKKLCDSVFQMKYPDYTLGEFEAIAYNLNTAINTPLCRNMIADLNKQISFSD